MHYVVRGSLSDVLVGTRSLYCFLRETWFTDWYATQNMILLVSWGLKKTINYYVEHGSLSLALRATYEDPHDSFIMF